MSEPAQLTPPPQQRRDSNSGLLTAWIAVIIAVLSVAISAYIWTQADRALGLAQQAKQNTSSLDTQLDTLESKVDSLTARQQTHSTKLQSQQSALQSQQTTIQNIQSTPMTAPLPAATTNSIAGNPSDKTQTGNHKQTGDNGKTPPAANPVDTTHLDAISNLSNGQHAIEKKVNSHSNNMQTLQQKMELQQKNLQQQSNTIIKQQHQLNLQSTALQDHSLSLQKARTEIQALVNNSARSSQQWILGEAEYLIRLASLQLHANNNVKAALQILKTVAQDLGSIKDNKLQPIRAALHHDIQVLQDIPPIHVNKIIAQLNHVSDQIGSLPTTIKAKFTSAKKTDPKKSADKTKEPEVTGYQATIAGLKNLVIIKKINRDPNPVITEDEANYLKENIRLKISQAEWAVLHKNQKLYEQSLSLAQNLLETSFSNSTAQALIKKIKKQIDALKNEKVRAQVPKLYTSIAAIRSMLTTSQPATATGAATASQPATATGSAAASQPATTSEPPTASQPAAPPPNQSTPAMAQPLTKPAQRPASTIPSAPQNKPSVPIITSQPNQGGNR